MARLTECQRNHQSFISKKALEIQNIKFNHSNLVVNFEQRISKLKLERDSIFAIHKKDYSSLEKKYNALNDKHTAADDKYRKNYDLLKAKHDTEIQDLKDKHKKYGDKFCSHELDLSKVKMQELKLEIDMCATDGVSLNFDSMKDMFNKERQKFDEILERNRKEFEEIERRKKERDEKLKKQHDEEKRIYDERLRKQQEDAEKERLRREKNEKDEVDWY